MVELNYSLSEGDITFDTFTANKSSVLFQLYYEGLVAADVVLEAWVGLSESRPFAKLDLADATLTAGGDTVIIALTDLPPCYVQFRLNVPTADTAGTVTEYEISGGY